MAIEILLDFTKNICITKRNKIKIEVNNCCYPCFDSKKQESDTCILCS